jgi:glycosyltransferase involved in cell wall biosynthesis
MAIKVNLLVGARFQAKLVANFLQKNNIDTNIYTSSPPKKWHEESLPKKKIIFVPLIFKIFSIIFRVKAMRRLREFDAIIFDFIASIIMRKSDLLHGWATFSLISAKKIKKTGGFFILERACPHVLFQEKLLIEEAFSLGIKYSKTSDYFIQRCIKEYELADKIIVPSMYSLNTFIEQGINRNKLELVRLDANFTKSGRKDYIKKNNSFIVGSVGGNPLRKGFLYLIEAWQKLKLPKAKLLLKTSESELQNIPILWDKIKDDSSIEIMGYFKRIEDFYLECDIFCLPSVDDGFGMVVFEALACGKPVIACENVGASEMLKHGETGFVVKARDVDSIAKYINKLYDDKELLKIMSKNALEFYDFYQRSDDNYEVSMKRVYDEVQMRLQ